MTDPPTHPIPAVQQWPAPPGPTRYAPPLPPPPPSRRTSRASRLLSAVTWNVAGTAVTPAEHARFIQHGIEAPQVQALLSWRRSAVGIALPLLVISSALAAVDAIRTETDYFTTLGQITVWVPPVALGLLLVGAAVTVVRWTRLSSTTTALLWCWVASIALPLCAALAPLDVLLDVDRLRAEAVSAQDLADLQVVISAGRLSMAIGYALTLLPVVISVPAGVLKGAWRVKSLFPSSALPGWFVVAVAPFYSLFAIVLFVLINQLAGNWLLLLGVAMVALAPWTFVVFRRIFVRPMAAVDAQVHMRRVARVARTFTVGGVVLLTIYLFTAEVDGIPVLGTSEDVALFSYLGVGRAVLEVLGRSVVTSAAFCMIFIGMLAAHWRADQALPGHVHAEYHEQLRVYSAVVDAQRPR